jgi:hypothetical protein
VNFICTYGPGHVEEDLQFSMCILGLAGGDESQWPGKERTGNKQVVMTMGVRKVQVSSYSFIGDYYPC